MVGINSIVAFSYSLILNYLQLLLDSFDLLLFNAYY